MMTFFIQGGPYMWLLLIFSVVILVLAVQKAIRLFKPNELNVVQFEIGLNGILFWGALSLLVGLFAHFQGVYIAMQVIAHAPEISPAIVAEGYSMSLITILSGLFIFIISLIIWFVLRWRFKRATV